MVFQLNRLFDTVRTGVSGWINKTLVEPFEAAVAKHKDKIEHDSGTTAALTQHKNPSLVDQLYSPQAAQVQAALSRILALVIVPDPRVTQAMVEHGVGIAVVRAMKNHPIDLAVQTLACKLLANLVYDHHPTANLIVEQGGVPLFVHAMRKFARDQTILRRSGSAMNNVLVVSTRDGNGPVVKKTAADVGAIPTFVAILKDHSNNLDTFSIACKCLESLTDANPSNVSLTTQRLLGSSKVSIAMY